MKIHALLLVVMLGCLAFTAAGADGDAGKPGSISGTVRFTGKVPPDKEIPSPDGAVIRHNDLVVDAKTKGLRYVAVILEDALAQAKLTKAPAVLVDQRDMVFVPRVLAVQHGQPVRFDNSDLCNHSVQAFSTVAADQFNRFAVPGQPIEHTFDLQKRPVVIGCSLHSWMRAWVYVVPHPWFAVSDAQGRFQLANVPPGKHVLRLTHPDTGLQERRPIEVQVGRTVTVTVAWDSTQTQPQKRP